MSSFKDLRIIDNTSHPSAFFPIPTVLIGTLQSDNTTSFGSSSQLQPYFIEEENYYAILLHAKNSSNTAQNILKNGKCTINFIPDNKKYYKEIVRLGFPGDIPPENMKDCIFNLEEGKLARENFPKRYPKVIKEAFQVLECTWMRHLDNADKDRPGILTGYEPPYHDFNGITSKYEAHFILRVDKILIKEKHYNSTLQEGRHASYPRIPINTGDKGDKFLWKTKLPKSKSPLLSGRESSIDTIRCAAERIDSVIKFADDACDMLVNVPKLFLPNTLKGCVTWAKENNVTLVTAEHINQINERKSRSKI